jgi:glycosyltransferase involved in cell wall biosynthesis
VSDSGSAVSTDERAPKSQSLRILFFVTRDWYHPATTGGDNTMWEYARYLASVGHRVTYVSAGYRGAPREEVLDGINVVRLGGVHSLWLRTFVHYMSKCRGRFDVVVTEGFGGSRIPRLAPLYVREPVITAWHQIHSDLFSAQYPKLLVGPLNLLERISAWVHRNTLVQAYTPEWQEAFPRIGFKPENIFVVPVSIREDWLVELGGLLSRKPTVLWIGKLRRYKCTDHVIRAMTTVVKRVPEARLIVAARHDDLAYERNLMKLVEELDLAPNVEFRFNVSDDEKRALLLDSRTLVLPSAVEGFGIVVLEANACGVPVVASSGVPEGAVQDHLNGLRYRYGDIDALGKAIVEILTDNDLCSRLSENGLLFARNFGWRKVSNRYEDVIKRAVAQNGLRG